MISVIVIWISVMIIVRCQRVAAPVCLLGSPEKAGSVGSWPGPPGSALATHTQSRQSWANMGKCGVWAILGKFGHVNETSLTSVAQQPIHLFIELQDKKR